MEYDGVIIKPSLEVLCHHGIKGQKWGVQNGPPYPLDRGRKQTKYGFKQKGGNARRVAKGLLVANAATLGIGSLATVPAVIAADHRSKTYTPGETTDKHYIRKGTKMYRVSSVDKENHVGETYVTYNPVDRAFYRAYIKSKNPGSKVYETTFKATQDLVVPSQKELADVQKKVIWSNPKLKKLSTEGFANFRAYGDYEEKKISYLKQCYDKINKKVKVSDIVSQKVSSSDNHIWVKTKNGKEVDLGVYNNDLMKELVTAYRYDDGSKLKKQILNQIKDQKISEFSVISLSMGTSKELKQAMIKELRSRGYNAMVDEAGIGALEVPGVNDKASGRVSREGVEPIIVFERSESLKPIKIKEVRDMDAAEDYQYYSQWRKYKNNAYRNITW